jgi:hypothetical protein
MDLGTVRPSERQAVAVTRGRRLFTRALSAAAAMVLAAAQFASASPLAEPPATQGATCTFGPYRSPAIGFVLPSVSEPDRKGQGGNEVNAVYRVFYIAGEPPTDGFAGWLTASFDGRYAFTQATLAHDGRPMSVPASGASSPDQLPLSTWLKPLARYLDPKLHPLLTANAVTTAIAPCFSTSWDGSSR